MGSEMCIRDSSGAMRLRRVSDATVAGRALAVTDIAYKIVDAAEWRAAVAEGRYDGAPGDLADGYIHMSTEAQLAETARRHFAGRDGLLLLDVDMGRLDGDVVWEPSRGGALFPHLYAALPVAAVVATRAFKVDAEGRMTIGEAA